MGDMRHWIGIDDVGTEGDYRWVNGRPASASDANLWLREEPNNEDATEDCGGRYLDQPLLLNDFRCTELMRGICEKPI